MGITQWVQTKLNPAPADPVQAKMFAFMPLIFTFMFATFPAGLVIYYTWNNLLSRDAAILHHAAAKAWRCICSRISKLGKGEGEAEWRGDGCAEDAARKLFAGPCDFVWGTGDINSLPPQSLPEVAFVGRSNAGKSSLINALTGRKGLARVSQHAGRAPARSISSIWAAS